MKNLPKNCKVALIELYPYHSELIYSQLLFLNKSKLYPLLICDIKNKIEKDLLEDISEIKLYDFSKLSSLFKLWYFIHKNKIRYLIINTAQGSRTLKLMLFPFSKKIKIAGIVHNTSKLKKSFGQKVIVKKIKRIYVLASYIKYHFPKQTKLQFEYINCSYIPPNINKTVMKSKDEIWIGVPGSIEYKRRDYSFLLELTRHPLFPQNIKIILLGNALRFDGPKFISDIKKYSQESKFIFFDSYVPNLEFQNYMENIDYLLPLIHPKMILAKDYLKYKVSGTFIQSNSYSKPMLCHSMFNNKEFKYSALFYTNKNDLINTLKTNELNINIQSNDFEKDRVAYMSLLEN